SKRSSGLAVAHDVIVGSQPRSSSRPEGCGSAETSIGIAGRPAATRQRTWKSAWKRPVAIVSSAESQQFIAMALPLMSRIGTSSPLTDMRALAPLQKAGSIGVGPASAVPPAVTVGVGEPAFPEEALGEAAASASF